MPKNKRLNKGKPQILDEIKQKQKSDHLREVMLKTVYPLLLELNETIGFAKVFLQTASMAAETEGTKMISESKLEILLPKLNEIFTSKDPKTEGQYFYYRKLFEAMKDEKIQDFVSLIGESPRYITGYFTHEIDKQPIMELDIKKILG